MLVHLSLGDRWRIISLRLDHGISPTRIAAVFNCPIRMVHNIVQPYRETNYVTEREGRRCVSLNNCKRPLKILKVDRMIKNSRLSLRV